MRVEESIGHSLGARPAGRALHGRRSHGAEHRLRHPTCGRGSCRVTVMAAVEPRGILARLTDPVVARAMGRTFRADLARLRRLLEGEAMRPPSEEAAGAPPTANE